MRTRKKGQSKLKMEGAEVHEFTVQKFLFPCIEYAQTPHEEVLVIRLVVGDADSGVAIEQVVDGHFMGEDVVEAIGEEQKEAPMPHNADRDQRTTLRQIN